MAKFILRRVPMSHYLVCGLGLRVRVSVGVRDTVWVRVKVSQLLVSG